MNDPTAEGCESSIRSEREIFLEKRIHDIEEQFRQFQATFNVPKKGKGRGKKTAKNLSKDQYQDEVQLEAQKRLRAFLNQSDTVSVTPSTSSNHSCINKDE